MTNPSTDATVPALRHMTEAELVKFALAGDYEILEELGRGGMAIVYRAREKALDREVAIKVLPSRLVIDEGFVGRFEHEARTSAKLEHPNIVPIYRVGRAGPNGEVIYFVMKFLRGQSLSSVLAERGKLVPADVRRILMETASALGYAAKHGVVHRDIKPDNIMLDSEGRCVVTDFGIAKAPGGQQTTAGTSLGTPRYMSPEHATGQPLDGRSDMYSLGIVAYQCLFGKPPFEADEPFAVLYKHIHDPLPQPTLATEEEQQLYPVIARMLAKKPDDRFQTGNELIAALGGATTDPSLVGTFSTNPTLLAATEVMPTPKPWSLSRWRMMSRTRQLVWSGVAVATIATVLGLVWKLPGSATAGETGAAPPTGTATTPPGASGPSSTPAGGQPVVAAVDTTPKGPSKRAMEILRYNRYQSSCPTRDTLPGTKAIAYDVMVDSMADRPRAPKMNVVYNVCGLGPQSPYSVQFLLTKLNQRGFRQQPRLEASTVASTNGPRSRKTYELKTEEMSAGSYRIDVIVTDSRQRVDTASREFKITDKK